MPTTVTLLEKVYGSYSLNAFEHVLMSLFEGLNVSLKVVNKTNRGWVQIAVSGEDETVTLNQLSEKVGIAPEYYNEVRKLSAVRGKVIFAERDGSSLYVDVGVFTPEIRDAGISLNNLQAQLADGKMIPLQQLAELFCFFENMPLRVRIIDNSDKGKEYIAAELSERQIAQFTGWIRSSLDRLIVFGVTASHLLRVVGKSNFSRDIIGVEELGILEQVLVCKLGTDAVGLIPKLGPKLPKTYFASFNPRKIQRLIKGRFVPL